VSAAEKVKPKKGSTGAATRELHEETNVASTDHSSRFH
jgi:hypothetical protein